MEARAGLQYCIAFDGVRDAASVVSFIKRCHVETTFYFNGSNDKPLEEQLKALYLKQELSKFAAAHQGKPAAELQQAFQQFVARVQPRELKGPTWRPGASSIDTAVIGEG